LIAGGAKDLMERSNFTLAIPVIIVFQQYVCASEIQLRLYRMDFSVSLNEL
jgi:hypothetical protein